MAVSVDLGVSLEAYLAELVASGRYGSEAEVVREGLRLIQEREELRVALDQALLRGLADVEAGRVVEAEPFLERLAARYER